MSRATMQFVPVERRGAAGSPDAGGHARAAGARRTQLSNAIRGYAAEFGLTAAKGLDKIEPLLAKIAADEALPVLARDLFAMHGREYVQLQAELKKIEARLMAWHRANTDRPASGADSGDRAGRRHNAGHEGARSSPVPVRPALRGLGSG